MRRTGFDDREDRRVADDYIANNLPCRWCGALVDREELATYGARCRPCYAEWQAEANPRWWPASGTLTADQRAAVRAKALRQLAAIRVGSSDPKRWARRLQAAEEAGQPLSAVQRSAWREALRVPDVVAEEAAA